MGKEGSATGRWDLSSLNATAEEHYLSCDATGFIKDLVAIPFSGHATSGMSWDENTDQTHWHWIGKVHNFLETEFLDEIDLNQDDWIPGYVNSGSLGSDEKAEVIYLRRTQVDHKKLIGVIINRTWNWYTEAEGGVCIVPVQDDLPISLQTFMDIGSESEPLKIPSMGFLTEYKIQYFDPLTLEIINEEVSIPIDGKLNLESYPLLTAGRPFVFFKAWRDQEGEQFMPPLTPQASDVYVQVNPRNHQSNSGTEAAFRRNQYFHNAGLKVWPNPSNGILNIEVESEIVESVEIYNLFGQLIKKCCGQRIFELDISSWPSGLYFVRCPEIQMEAKFVKL